MKNLSCALQVAPDVTVYHTGPALDHGPLPSLFYFALSGPDSLTLDPYNQPVQFMQNQMIRTFSMTLPGHENGLPASKAMQVWKEDLIKGIDCINDFLDAAQMAVDFVIREKFADPAKLAVAGLSRGGFIAAHLAAREEKFRHILGFAPLTRLSKIKEFANMDEVPLAKQLDLLNIADKIADRHVQLFIGNEDTRVGTKDCFEFATKLVENKKGKVSHVQFSTFPSIGHMGHGTPLEIFQLGANWILSHLIHRHL